MDIISLRNLIHLFLSFLNIALILLLSGINRKQGFPINVINPTATDVEENIELITGFNV